MLALLGLLWSALHFGKGMLVHFDPTAVPQVDNSPSLIPYYAGRTLLRMWIAFSFSLLFAIGTGYLAAKNRTARAFILPALDVLQSVPVLGFLVPVSGWALGCCRQCFSVHPSADAHRGDRNSCRC